jgi:hypothetical protein
VICWKWPKVCTDIDIKTNMYAQNPTCAFVMCCQHIFNWMISLHNLVFAHVLHMWTNLHIKQRCILGIESVWCDLLATYILSDDFCTQCGVLFMYYTREQIYIHPLPTQIWNKAVPIMFNQYNDLLSTYTFYQMIVSLRSSSTHTDISQHILTGLEI